MKREPLRAYLRRGGLIAYPTESCYGLGCDPLNPGAVRRLARLKGRPVGRGLILIADRFERFRQLVQPLNTEDLSTRHGDLARPGDLDSSRPAQGALAARRPTGPGGARNGTSSGGPTLS